MQNVNGTATYANHVLIGPWKTGYPASTFAASYSAAVATSVGANLSAVAGATAGVVIP